MHTKAGETRVQRCSRTACAARRRRRCWRLRLQHSALLGLALGLGLAATPASGQATPHRSNLVRAVLSDDAAEQIRLTKQLTEANDPMVARALAAWRQSELYVSEMTDGTKVPFLLEAQTDSEGRAKGIRLADGELMTDAGGHALTFLPAELTPADTSGKLRKAIKTTLDLYALDNPNPKMRRDAVIKLGQDQDAEYLPHFKTGLGTEKDLVVRRALEEAVALTEMIDEDPNVRVPAIRKLGALRSINSLAFVRDLEKRAKADPERFGAETSRSARSAIVAIEAYQRWGNLVGTAFRGLSLGAVLLVAALGLAITFGLMGVINMAHGEIIMVGAYTAYVTQNLFKGWFGGAGSGFDAYFIAALALSFLAAGLVGLALERSVIRFLYQRPLESLLATWGVSLVMQQVFRHTFGAANVQVSSPSWLSGSFVIHDVLFAYNRLFVIGFAAAIVLGTGLLLTRTSGGLQVRAVMQNRAMAGCLGVRTDRVNQLTFAFGSGLAGMAGACLSQIGNVGPSLGQSYIVDCFMIVVLGGVGNILGTVSAALGVGLTDQILQPWLGAVLGKITVLAGIIAFLQWRPAGLFMTRNRGLEG